MTQLWTIIFFTGLAIAFVIAAWHDHEENQRRERRNVAHEQVERTKD